MQPQEYNKEATDLIHNHIYESLKRIELQVTYTNGKLKKLTVALVAVAAFAIGTGLTQLSPLLKLIL